MPRMASVGHRLGVREPQEPAQQVAVAPRPLDDRALRRRRHRDVHPVVPGHGLGRGVPRVVRPGEPHEQEERRVALVVLDPADRLGAVPGVDVGRAAGSASASSPTSARTWWRSGRSRCPPGRLRVGDVRPVRLEQALARQVVAVAGRDRRHELVAGLEDLGEPERLEPPAPSRSCARSGGSRRGRGGPCPAAPCGSRPHAGRARRSGCRPAISSQLVKTPWSRT